MTRRHEAIPKDWPVQPVAPGTKGARITTDGYCGLSWDDGIITSMTPAPSARCPFEQFHVHPDPRGWRYTEHEFEPSEPYANYCGVCALSKSGHNPGPNFIDPMEDDDDETVAEALERTSVMVPHTRTATFFDGWSARGQAIADGTDTRG